MKIAYKATGNINTVMAAQAAIHALLAGASMVRFVLGLVSLTILASCATPPTSAPHAPVVVCECGPPDRTYLVFFDPNKTDLKPRSKRIIQMVASDRHSLHGTTVDVSGYTDNTGTAGQNIELSARRAQAVAAQLVADGVPLSAITTHAYGEAHQLVPTLDGVAEPQNRRVEIVLAWPMYGP